MDMGARAARASASFDDARSHDLVTRTDGAGRTEIKAKKTGDDRQLREISGAVSIRGGAGCRLDKGDNAMATTLDPHRTASPATVPRSGPGWVLSGIPAAFLAFDAAIKLVHPAFVTEASVRIGVPPELSVVLGVLLAACLALYLIPRSAPLGAVLLTGYLGGAVLTHLRIGDPMISHTLFPIYVGALLWTGLYLRDDRVRRLVAAR
jgi:hypothetical protein